MSIIGVIPARYQSTRFPGKPLVIINGKSMIQRVYEQALKCAELDKVIVATDDEAIRNHVRTFNGQVVMTSPNHRSGTERCAEVIEILEEKGEKYHFVVNIQGDEPFIKPEQISRLTRCLTQHNPELATLIKKISSVNQLQDLNVVKTVVSTRGKALWFSRNCIPVVRGKPVEEWLNHLSYYHHIGIYGYQSEILQTIVKLTPSPAELAESLEQLRWIENGFSIQTEITEYESIAIDVPEDVLKIPAGYR